MDALMTGAYANNRDPPYWPLRPDAMAAGQSAILTLRYTNTVSFARCLGQDTTFIRPACNQVRKVWRTFGRFSARNTETLIATRHGHLMSLQCIALLRYVVVGRRAGRPMPRPVTLYRHTHLFVGWASRPSLIVSPVEKRVKDGVP